MRINNNLMAINTHRQLGISSTAGARSMEKLSSGLRINRAGDDAAGLAISEKMRGQIRGLSQASRNSADTISMIQTAEGALSESQNILKRMRELAVQSANDTNTASDRSEIQAEVSELIKELDRIGNTTEFNTKKLLDGSTRGVSDSVAATAQLNGNSGMTINLDMQNAFIASVNNDVNFFMDGAHMLMKINNTTDAQGNSVFSLENDYKLIGPDGTEFSFAKGDSTNGKAYNLLDNSILTSAQRIVGSNATDKGTVGGTLTLGGQMDGTKVGLVRAGSTLVAGSNFNFLTTNGGSLALSVNDATLLVSFEKISGIAKIGDTIMGNGDSYTLKDGSILTYTTVSDGGTFTVTKGSVTTASDMSATSANKNVNSFILATNSVLVSSEVNLLAGSNELIATSTTDNGLLARDVVVGAGSTIGVGSKIGVGSILTAGSTFKVGALVTSPFITNAIGFKVNGADAYLTFTAGEAQEVKAVNISGTAITSGFTKLDNGTYQLGEAILLHNGDGNFTILSGNLEIGGVATDRVDVGNGVKNITYVADGSLLKSSASLTNTTQLANGTSRLVTGALFTGDGTNAALLAAGTVMTSANSTAIGGAVIIGGSGESISFAGKHTLMANISQITVGLSQTFAFAAYQGGSNDLQNSVMSQVGANSGQTLFVSVGDMRAKALGVDKVDISTRYGAATAQTTIDNALQQVSHQRSLLGAMQNRLEATIRNLDATAENVQSAESRVRDVDMAKEIMENTKQNILQQASQAMLAQANQAPQSVLQLLR